MPGLAGGAQVIARGGRLAYILFYESGPKTTRGIKVGDGLARLRGHLHQGRSTASGSGAIEPGARSDSFAARPESRRGKPVPAAGGTGYNPPKSAGPKAEIGPRVVRRRRAVFPPGLPS